MGMTKEAGESAWKKRLPEWIAACVAVHGDKYDYALAGERVLKEGRWYVNILCKTHGPFLQSPAKHKSGKKCPVCSGNKLKDPVDAIRNAFPEVIVPDDLVIEDSKTKFALACPVHGAFEVSYNQLMQTKAKARVGACPRCNQANRGARCSTGGDKLLERLGGAFPDFVFCVPERLLTQNHVTYKCPTHGVSSSKLCDMLNGHACHGCGQEKRRSGIYKAVGVTLDHNLVDVFKEHAGRVIPHAQTLGRTHDKGVFSCLKHGVFESHLYSVKAGHGCPKCSHRVSRGERELLTWLQSLKLAVEVQSTGVLETKGWVDIYLPEHGVAIEYCGLYWHGEMFKDRMYHASRAKDAAKGGVRLITLFEDEWLNKRNVVERVLLSTLALDKKRVSARKTTLVEVAWAEAAAFYEANHLQGQGAPCNTNYALVYEGRFVAMASFRRGRYGGADYELMRFAHSVRVVGGLSKLVSAFAKTHDGATLVSYCDRRWFTGRAYERAGFVCTGESSPGYWWCKGSMRHSREKFQKHKLGELLSDYDQDVSEAENMRNNGYWKIWDCGMLRWEKAL